MLWLRLLQKASGASAEHPKVSNHNSSQYHQLKRLLFHGNIIMNNMESKITQF